ncbi:MAG: two-component system phosphate regulon sensor histidine kinase PhoR [Methylophagaceae bacterium]|jgi:two-component system phosphate regulon sensor histidine kinase PhoR
MSWDYWRLLTIVFVAGFVGLLFNQMMMFMFVATFIYTLWLQESWFKLEKWLHKPKKRPSPSAEGVIDNVCREIEQVRQQNSSRKKKLAGYLKRFQSATAALPDGIVVLGEFGEVDWANDSAKVLLGVRWPRDSHVRVNNLIRDPDFQQLIADSNAIGKTVIVASPVDLNIQLEIKIVSYMGNGRMLLARDMTQTVKLQKMRRDFVANVSHELRTPLTVLRGYLEMFDDETPATQWQKALPAMRQQSERMSNMLQELLTLSRLETGEKTLHAIPADVGATLQEIIADATQLTQYDSHEIKLNLNTDDWLLADIDELRSALSNLIFNAVNYTPPGTVIAVTWSIHEDEGVIEVKDQGEGIPEHHLERLTERFYRVDSARSQRDGGTGLGLAIVKHVLQRHGAILKISSDLGYGSVFTCYFPIQSVLSKPKALSVAVS